MRLTLLLVWISLPLAVTAFHFGPGQQYLKNDHAAQALDEAQATLKLGDDCSPDAALAKIDLAISELPPEDAVKAWQLRLTKAKARMDHGQLPTAHDELVSLLGELSAPKEEATRKLAESPEGQALRGEVQSTLGKSKYYMTWLMRLEGVPEDTWRPEIEASRQHFRHLAEQAEKSGQTAVFSAQQENLESAIKLARMDLTDLQGLPLPKQ